MKMLTCPRCKMLMDTYIERVGDRIGYFCQKYGHWIRWLSEREMEQRGFSK